MTVKALKEAWEEVVMAKKVMIRAFEKTGIILKVDGSEDTEKMKFQPQHTLYFSSAPLGGPECTLKSFTALINTWTTLLFISHLELDAVFYYVVVTF